VVKPARKFGWWRWLLRAAGALLLAFIALIVGVRYFGLPDAVGERIRRELLARGLQVRAERLYLDWLGRVQARNVHIAMTGAAVSLHAPGQELAGVVRVEKAQVRFNWFSWWRGESFVSGASVARADLSVQLDTLTVIRIEDVHADVTLHEHAIEMKYLRGTWRHLRVDVAGTVELGRASSSAGAPPDLARLAVSYRKLEEAVAEWTARTPLTLTGTFKLPLAESLDGEAHLRLAGENQWWRGARLTRVAAAVDYAEGEATLTLTAALARGQVNVSGAWRRPDRFAELSFHADADWSRLAAALPEEQGRRLAALRFNTLPVTGGTVRLSWADGLAFAAQVRCDWRDFMVGEQPFDLFECAVVYDGQRLMVTGLNARGPAGTLAAELFYDGAATVHGRVDSAIDPRAFRALCGAGAQPFFNSLAFAAPPRVTATVSGSGLAPELLTVSGTVTAANFSYKGVAIVSAASEFDFQRGEELHLAKLRVKRAEGEGGGEIWDNFKTKQVRVKGVKATLNAQDTALVLGDKMAEYLAPYRFIDTPTFTIDGHFDLNDAAQQFRTDMKARVVSKKGAHYVFLGRELTLSALDLNITVKGQELTLTPNRPLTVFDGQLDGALTVTLVEDPAYDTRLRFKNNDFGALMKTFFHNDKVTGRIGGELVLRGAFSDWKTMRGHGTLTVRDGALYNIPFLGGLSDLLNVIIPDMGYAKASEAESKFTVSDGVIQMSRLDIHSLFFVLIGHGHYDFIGDNLELDMRVNLRGAPGVATWLLSKMFEYHGTGPITKTKWETKNF
jgi:hypothetical protein